MSRGLARSAGPCKFWSMLPLARPSPSLKLLADRYMVVIPIAVELISLSYLGLLLTSKWGRHLLSLRGESFSSLRCKLSRPFAPISTFAAVLVHLASVLCPASSVFCLLVLPAVCYTSSLHLRDLFNCRPSHRRCLGQPPPRPSPSAKSLQTRGPSRRMTQPNIPNLHQRRSKSLWWDWAWWGLPSCKHHQLRMIVALALKLTPW